MKHARAVLAVAAASLALGAGLLAAFRRWPMLPPAASAEAAFIDSAWNGLLVIETAVYALVAAFIAYCLLRFRAKDRSEQGAACDSSPGRLVETGWILGSLLLTLGLAAFGAKELRAVVGGPEAEVDVEVRASQFSWEFYYPKYGQYGTKLFLKNGARHRVILTSKDVVHSFWIPEFRLKQDAVPGKVIHLLLTPVRGGEYSLLCSELCGWGHTEMTALAEVLEPSAFEERMKSDF